MPNLEGSKRSSLVSVLLAGALLAAPAQAEDLDVTRRAASLRADNTKAPFVADDVFRIVYAIDPRISPDGDRVVFVREAVDLQDDRWHGHLWVVGTDGAPARPLTDGHHYDSSPRISPDGRRVAFFSDRSGTPEIYVKTLDAAVGQPATQVTRLGTEDEPWGLAWSPDGASLSFVARESRPARDLGPLSPPPPGARWGEPPLIIDRLVYRVDGRGYLEPGCERLFVVSAAGGEARRATGTGPCLDEATPDPLNHERDGGAPVWSPDGKYLITAANHRDERQKTQRPIDLDLYEIELATGTMRPLLQRPGLESLPTVSPDGSLVAFVGFEEQAKAFQVARLYVAQRDGGSVRQLTTSLDRDVESPRWTSDGRSIVFTYHDHGTTRIAQVDLEGRIRLVAEGVSDGYSAYDGGGFTLSRNGRLAFTHSSHSLAGEVAVADLEAPPTESATIHRLTALNDPWLANRRLAEVEEMHFEGAHGRRIQGWLMRPSGAVTGRESDDGPPPVVLDVHGGPFLNWGARFDLDKQILASRGFAVLFVNPRGSTGYGEDFANLIDRKYPGDDVHDLSRAIDQVVARGEADGDRLFVTGGSGGAFLTFALLAETSRFRAAVAIYPLVNWSSFVLTSDYAPIALGRWLPGPPWQEPRHYLDHSTIWKAHRIDTPTLVIAGEEDYRTPMSEAEQIFAALQIRGVESVLVRLPEAAHFAERRPSHYRARVAYGVHWFESHLESAPSPAP